jgi:DNA uptake protein ComE-like DNA-binding protein
MAMWKKFVSDYLNFTKKDRIGVMVLLALIFIIVLLPCLWPVKKTASLSKTEVEKIKLLAARLNTPGADQKEDKGVLYDYPVKKEYNKESHYKEKTETFYFDPNTLDAAGWKRLGIRDRTVTTIQNFLGKGGKFRKPEDIGKIYGLFKDDYERLLPFVKIKNEAGFEKKNYGDNKEPAPADKPVYATKKIVSLKIIDINTADTTALIALPGIGSKLATRIVNFRNKLGGFYAVQQVAETFGLPDSTFSKIQPLLQCNQPKVQQIDINTADANTLKQHPYIRWNLANVIVQYRNQHGNFKSVEDLQLISIITPEILKRIKPYLFIQ